MLDAINIRKQLVYDGHKKTTCGFVDIGAGAEEHSEALASEALVFMLVGLRAKWKCPVAYYLTKGLTSETQTELVQHCLQTLTDMAFYVHAVVMDGHATNLGMCSRLGACMDIDNLEPYFNIQDRKIHIILDACHMVKLVRNMWQHFGVIKSPNGIIMWNYIKDLHTLQQDIGLRLANKLTDRHTDFQNQKMKVLYVHYL
jgi:hypothetical protein